MVLDSLWLIDSVRKLWAEWFWDICTVLLIYSLQLWHVFFLGHRKEEFFYLLNISYWNQIMQKVEIKVISSQTLYPRRICDFDNDAEGRLSIKNTRLFIFSWCYSQWKILGAWCPNAFLKYKSLIQKKKVFDIILTMCWRYGYFSYYFISKLKLGICHFHLRSSILGGLAFSVDILIEVKRCKYMPNETIHNTCTCIQIYSKKQTKLVLEAP